MNFVLEFYLNEFSFQPKKIECQWSRSNVFNQITNMIFIFFICIDAQTDDGKKNVYKLNRKDVIKLSDFFVFI